MANVMNALSIWGMKTRCAYSRVPLVVFNYIHTYIHTYMHAYIHTYI